jgi:hypothetical protein
MNEAHIRAVLQSTGNVKTAQHNGLTLCTNGHIACRFVFPGAQEFDKLSKLWEKWEDKKANPTPHHLTKRDGLPTFVRVFSKAGINEAYFRCFDEPGVTWTETGVADPLMVHSGAELIALVMPIRMDQEVPRDIESATDREVFEELACEANGYYLVGDKKLKNEIAQLEEDLSEAREREREAEQEVSDLEATLERKRGLLKVSQPA